MLKCAPSLIDFRKAVLSLYYISNSFDQIQVDLCLFQSFKSVSHHSTILMALQKQINNECVRNGPVCLQTFNDMLLI